VECVADFSSRTQPATAAGPAPGKGEALFLVGDAFVGTSVAAGGWCKV
jgi:hypothetical protein